MLSSMATFMLACTENNDDKNSKHEDKDSKKASGDHIWKHQTDALKTSKEVAKKLQEQLNQQQKKLDESN